MIIDVVVTIGKGDRGQIRDRWIVGKCHVLHQPDETHFKKWGIDPATVIICRRRRMWGHKVWQIEVTKKTRNPK